jgi:hypothetical protein
MQVRRVIAVAILVIPLLLMLLWHFSNNELPRVTRPTTRIRLCASRANSGKMV